MSPLDFLILSLATWRLSSLLTWERGPLAVFERLRKLARIEHSAGGHPQGWPTGSYWAELLTCIWCASPYVALGWFLAYAIGGVWVIYAAMPFALSAAAIVIQKQARNG